MPLSKHRRSNPRTTTMSNPSVRPKRPAATPMVQPSRRPECLPGRRFPAQNLSGETVSAVEPPSLSDLPVPRECSGNSQLIGVVGRGGSARSIAEKTPSSQRRRGQIPQKGHPWRRDRAGAFHPGGRPRPSAIQTRYRSISRAGRASGPLSFRVFVEGSPQAKARFLPQEGLTPRGGKTVRDLAKALHYAHGEGIIHRDVKPANIWLDVHGEPFQDGFRPPGTRTAKRSSRRDHSGNARLHEPEQRRPAGRRRTDVYSLGVVLYELLTCQRPFQGNVHSVLHQVVHANFFPKMVNALFRPTWNRSASSA